MNNYNDFNLKTFPLNTPKNRRYARFYVKDLIICLEVLPQNGSFITSRILNEKGIPRRTANHRISKLVRLTILKRHGRTRCPYQWYNLNEQREILEFLRKTALFFAQNPQRTYIENPILNTWLGTWQSMKSEKGSVPFGFPHKIWDRKVRNWREWREASKYDTWLIRTDPFYMEMVLQDYRTARFLLNNSEGFTESDLIWLTDLNVEDLHEDQLFR